MIFGNRRHSRTRALVSLVTMTTFLAGMLPLRSARADIQSFPPIEQGTGGGPTLASPTPQAGSAEALATVDLATGATTSSFPFRLPAARGQAQPSLSLVYSSSSGVGLAGVGWTLDLPSIERRGSSGMPRFDDDVLGADSFSDKYVFGGEPLVPICTLDSGGQCPGGASTNGDFPHLQQGEQVPGELGGWTYFRTEIDDGMRFFLAPGRRTWRVQTKQGVTLLFGDPGDAVVGGAAPVETMHEPLASAQPASPVYRWNLSRQIDSSGNTVYYVWARFEVDATAGVDSAKDQGREYLLDIYDTPRAGSDVRRGAEALFAHHVHLTWSRPDARNALFALSPSWRTPPSLHLEHVDVTSSPFQGGRRELVRRYWLDYQTLDHWGDAGAPKTDTQVYLAGIRMEGTCHHWSESPQGLLPQNTNCPQLPALSMTYAPPADSEPPFSLSVQADLSHGPPGPYLIIDTNGDALPELFGTDGVQSGGSTPSLPSNPPLKATLDDLWPSPYTQIPRYVLGDWLGDGRVNWLWFVNASTNGSTQQEIPYELYSFSGQSTMQGSGGQGYFLKDDQGSPQVDPPPQDDFQTHRAMDIDGDGLTDMALVPYEYAGTNVYSYFTARNVAGSISPLERRNGETCINKQMWGFRNFFSGHATQRVVTDFDGDGLADVVVLENLIPYRNGESVFGEVVAHVFKNRGDGRFGSPDASAPSCAGSAYAPYDVTFYTGDGIDDTSFTYAASMHDIDGDGVADLVWLDPSGLHVVLAKWEASQNEFVGDQATLAYGASLSDLKCNTNDVNNHPEHNLDITGVSLQFADMNASGVDDLVVLACGYMDTWKLNAKYRPGLLRTISNGAGANTTIEYDSLVHKLDPGGGQPNVSIPVPAQLVTRVTTSNGLTGPYARNLVTSYSYEDPVYDARDHAFLGFQTVKTTQPGTQESPGLDTTTHFATGTCPPGTGCEATPDYGWRMQRGLPAVVEQFEDTGSDQGGVARHLTTTIDTYRYDWLYLGHDGRVVRQVYLQQTDTYLWDRDAQTAAQVSPTVLQGNTGFQPDFTFTISSIDIPDRTGGHLQQVFQRDSFGNPVWSLDRGLMNRASAQPAQPQDTPILTQTQWELPQGDPTGWNWRPMVSTTSYADASGNVAGSTREVDFSYYANGLLETIAAPLEGSLPLARKNPGGQVALPPDDASHDTAPGKPLVLSFIAYDSYGNPRQVVHAGGQCSVIGYDHVFAQLPTLIAEYDGGCGSEELVTSRTYDRGLEVVTSEVSPALHLSMATYDAFGRQIAAYQPAPDSPLQTAQDPLVRIDYGLYDKVDPNKPVRRLMVSTLAGDDPVVGGKGHTPVYRTEWQYFDSLGQPLVTVGQAETPGQWVVSGARALEASTGRALQAWRPFFINLAQGSLYDVQSSPMLSYSPRQLSYDGLGRILTQVDELKRTTQLSYHASTLSVLIQDPAQLSGGHKNASTTLVYDGHGRLIQRVAALPNAPTADTIATTYTYQATGEIAQIQKTHAAGSDVYTRSMTYDSLGRMVSNFEPNTSEIVWNDLAPAIYEWRYAYNDAGQLVGTSDARGCGENIKYDALGRILGEDYSPCDPSQAPYSKADWSTGNGLESRFVYDAPEVTGTQAVFYRGFQTASYDRAQHTQLALDGRGRVKAVRRQVTSYGAEYAPHWFERDFQYDDANHVVDATTGADVPELMPNGASSVDTHYTVRGGVDRVISTYGDGHLLDSRTFWPTGEAQTSVLGDVSHATEDAQYNPDGSLLQLHVHRTPGPWASSTATYSPAAANDPVNIGDLQDLVFQSYDGAGNPTTIADQSTGAWPAGSSPVTRELTYDDAYRLINATLTYPSGNGFKSPYAAEEQKGDHSFPAPAPLPNPATRPTFQSFSYDWLDNVLASDDDLHVAPDRSFGAGTYPPTANNGAANRLLSTTQGGTTIGASYDAAGNTTGVTVTRSAPCGGPCVSQYKYYWDEVGRLQFAERYDGDTASSTQIQVAFGYLYDSAGERVLAIELDDARPDAGTARSNISYDVDVFPSLRIHTRKIDGNNDYDRSADSEIVYLQDGAGQTYGRAFYDAATVPLPSATGSRVHVFLELGDHLGSNSVVIDKDSGEVVERASYLTYGAVDTDFRPDRWGDYRASYRYSGHRDAAEVGLVYFGQRYYLPMLARWASPDPLTIHALGSQMNPYGFVGGSPLANVDPAGLDGCDMNSPQCGGGGGGVAGDISAIVFGLAGLISKYHTSPERGTGRYTVSLQMAPTLTPWSPSGSSSFITPTVTSSPTRWVDPTGGGAARWNPNGFGGTATMLLGVPTSLTLDEVAPELAHAIHVMGPLVLGAVPILGQAIALQTVLDANATTGSRWIAGVGLAAAVVPFVGGELGSLAREGTSLLTSEAAGAAPEATQTIAEGTKVYRAFGGEATPFGNPAGGSYTTVDPATVENFREAAGLFPGNAGRFVLEGELISTEGVTVRAALPGPGGVGGGLPEVVIPNASQQVLVTRVSGVNPEL